MKNLTYILARIIGTLFFLLCLWGGGFLLYTAASLSMRPHDPAQKTDAIVVLTGGNTRIEEGINLWASGKSTRLFITGVHPSVRASDITALWKKPQPLPECCLELGHRAESTTENVTETAAWLREKKNISSIRLVTANYHMIRALIEYRHAFPELQIIPHPIRQVGLSVYRSTFWILMFSEYHKSIVRSLRIIAGLEPRADIKAGT